MKRHAGVQSCVLCFTLSWTSLDMTVLHSQHPCTLILPDRIQNLFSRQFGMFSSEKTQKLPKVTTWGIKDTRPRRPVTISPTQPVWWDNYEIRTLCKQITPWFATKDRSVLAHSQRPSGRAIPPISDPEYLRYSYVDLIHCGIFDVRKKGHLRFFLPE